VVLTPDSTLTRLVDVDEVTSQFEVVRHISVWNKAETLQERAQACPRSMKDLRKL